MPQHAIALHLRRIAVRLDGHPERRNIEQLADGFDALVLDGADRVRWRAERDRLLSAVEGVASVFERSEEARFRELAMALQEFAVMLNGLPARE